jgi:hypothetical protein
MEDIRGNIKTYAKDEIAMQYLNLALREYMERNNLVAVINLAAAAEELLGEIVSLKNKDNAHKRTRGWWRKWYEITNQKTPPDTELSKLILLVKNGIKHIDGENDLTICFDAEREAKKTIQRAIVNFNKLPNLQYSKELLAYYRQEKS